MNIPTIHAVPAARGHRRFATTLVLAVVAAGLTFGLASQTSQVANAAAAPVAQCNNDTASNVGGQGIACTVIVDNYVAAAGGTGVTPTAPSTITVTRCVGAAGPVALGAGCTTTSTTSSEVVTLVQQCNGSGNGGGGVVKCTVLLTNHFSTTPAAAPLPATVYQCIGSVITGTGAPGFCTPANTPGVTSVTAATVGQCNGSGNGGTSVGFVCTVTGGSTMTTTLPVNIDQCNGSGNGGGALVNCTATVTNAVAAGSTTSTPTVSATSTPTGATASPTATPTGSGTSTPTASATSTPTGTTSSATPTPTGSGTSTPAASATGMPAPTSTLAPASPSRPPLPPATGDGPLAGGDEHSQALLWFVAVTVLTMTAGLGLARRKLLL